MARGIGRTAIRTSPGGPNLPPTPGPTPTPTNTPTATASPTETATATITPTPIPPGFIALNEILAAPRTIDFNGDGEANTEDEYIELFNPQAVAIDLGGWRAG